MTSKFQRAIGRVKDQTSISLAKVGGSTLLSDLDVAIVKATRHEEYPADERYVREILMLTSSSRAYVSACVNTLSRRLNKTKNWTVALKTLMLIHRLLTEAARRMSKRSSSRRGAGPGFSTCRTSATPGDRTRGISPHSCGLTRCEAKCNRVVTVALYPIVKESFQVHYDMNEIMAALIDRFTDVDMPDAMKIYEVFCRQSKQFEELDAFYSWSKTVGVARLSEFTEIERITQKKLDLLDELIRDKSALEQGNLSKEEPNHEPEEIEEPEPEEDNNAVKALPPRKISEDSISFEDHADKLALALFDGPAPAKTSTGPTWEDLKDETDWETALVQSASSLSNQKAELGGGFDKLLLDGMYQQGQTMAAMQSCATTGSASSVAFGSAGRPAMLALPTQPSSDGDKNNNGSTPVDPFAVSLTVAPPSYVQMSDMEKKQKLLVEEQAMWDQYRRNGLQGHVGTSNVQAYPYNHGGIVMVNHNSV
ncbi:putative clathrin assembly protein [Hibiscus syriacus]|uniref:Clathrin assembly protein n=1 Tax=Hibiscus syriacus TaxID=106335 RepID=A0A6A2XTF7_HIBSY|nr:putative clathrin assembly protein [Hibiscus syriacus]